MVSFMVLLIPAYISDWLGTQKVSLKFITMVLLIPADINVWLCHN